MPGREVVGDDATFPGCWTQVGWADRTRNGRESGRVPTLSGHDAFDELARLDPVDEAALPSHDSPHGRQLFAEITATPRRPRPASLRHRRVIVAIAVGIAAIAAIGAAWIMTRPVTESHDIVCYQAADSNSDRVGVGYGDYVAAEACARFWADGTLTNPEFGPEGSVPPLVACVSAAGSLAVFPSEDPSVCQNLGLDSIDEASLPAADAIRDLNDALVDYFLADPCIPIPWAVDDVRDVLDSRGFADWTLTRSAGSRQRPCASFSMEVETTTIFIVPIPESNP